MANDEVSSLLSEIAEIKRRAEAETYLANAGALSDMNTRLKQVLPTLSLDDASSVMQAFYPLVFSGMIEIGETDADVRQKLAATEDVVYLLKVEEVGFALCLAIQGGKFSYQFSEPAHVDVTMKTSPEALVRIMTGQTDAFEAFMEGVVQMEGSIIKARGLRAVFEALGDRFGFRLMEFSS
jgi:putative sterol carrier protein